MTTIKRRPKPYPRYTGARVRPQDIPLRRAAALDPYVDAIDPEELRRANTVASDGGQCMIYRRPA